MAVVTSRIELKQYGLRALGAPVVRINVEDLQLEDRIDEALAYYRDYHYDGIERLYLSHEVTQTDIDNGYIELSPLVEGVVKVYPINGVSTGSGLFSAKFQLVATDIMRATSFDLINYEQVMEHIQLLDDVLTGHKIYQFNRNQNKLFIEQKWTEEMKAGDWILVQCYRALDPLEYTRMWNDPFLKHYTTALFKKQWGTNLKKFNGIQLPGGQSIDGQALYDEAISEINDLEEEMLSKSAVLDFFVG